MNRNLTILGTSSRISTKERNHNGYFLQWDREGNLFDPFEREAAAVFPRV